MSTNNEMNAPTFLAALLAGGCAGLAVDVSLYPLDTLKTRLQSPQGFLRAGGFRGIYNGLSVAALGSAPGAALFFSSYEGSKVLLPKIFNLGPNGRDNALVHMGAASISEVVACLVRVPTEVMKQRYQAAILDNKKSLLHNLRTVASEEGILGFYRGFGITILREIPFSLIQFPIYEALKIGIRHKILGDKRDLYSVESALCGSFSGGIAACLTTPLDVMKTRLMLGKDIAGVPYKGVSDTLKRLHIEAMDLVKDGTVKTKRDGLRRVFFAGVEPRVMWISIGGFVFFGAYEQALVGTKKLAPRLEA